jgi:5-methylcytosine-specific restriction endonuclease McrA
MNKKQTTEYIQKTIASLSVCKSVKKADPRFYAFLLELFKSHPNPERAEFITDIEIKRNAMFHQLELGVWKGATFEEISWKKCLGHNPNRLLSAMRYEITSQILAFGFQAEQVCVECGRLDCLVVDHIEPFSLLVKEFKSICPIPTVFTDGIGNQSAFHKEEPFAAEWSAYHKRRATLQMLCSPCNAKKGSRVLLNGVSHLPRTLATASSTSQATPTERQRSVAN